MLNSLNRLRAGQGLAPLSIDAELTRLARLRLQDLAANHVFQHDTPTYGTAYQMERAFGDHWRVMGAENLAANRDVYRAELALESDPSHRANIVYPSHSLVGIAVVHGPYSVMICELFAGN
ncbi:MAG: hypothetical protein IMW98_04535 [Firmicutes bacterium]|nr:hypothetical protein [Bacillota bacterium]